MKYIVCKIRNSWSGANYTVFTEDHGYWTPATNHVYSLSGAQKEAERLNRESIKYEKQWTLQNK
jgi:hypothetical protein